MSDYELGVFLRARRESVTPAEVGLPTGSRRRTPGLRRAELATLAGISVEYLTRLEQGRDRHPSAQVLGAIADTLRLTPAERLHLRRLSKADGGVLCIAAGPPARTVRPTMRALLDSLEPSPAVLLNRLNDVVALTSGYRRLVEPLGILDPELPNLIRYVFTDPRARDAYPDWERVADDQVAALRFESGNVDPHVVHLAEDLTVTVGAPFADRWARAMVLPRRTGVERLVHPEVGELRLAHETLEVPDSDNQRLVVHLPADDASASALARLAGRRPGGLRAIPG